MQRLVSRKGRGVLTCTAILCMAVSSVWADGTETLGDPSIPIAGGTGIAGGGTGLFTQPGSITVEVPAGATVQQVLLYWGGVFTTNLASEGDDTIVIEGIEVQGTLIGGPTLQTRLMQLSSYRADITDLRLISAGSNTVSLEGLDFQNDDFNDASGNNGASIVVIYDDGTTAHDIVLRDGCDFAFFRFAEPRQTTVPQTFSFAPASVDRQAEITTIVYDVDPADRPNVLAITMDGIETEIPNPWASLSGDQWDHLVTPITIPAGVSELTLRAWSRRPAGVLVGNPASLTWMVGALDVPPPAPGEIGDTVFCDENGNGTQDPGEPGLQGVTVDLVCAGDDGVLGTADDLESSTTTDANGNYLFTGVPAGLCEVSVDASSTPADCGEEGQCPLAFEIQLGEGESVLDADFCFRRPPPGTIGDTVYCDDNDNGVQDPGEPGIPGVTVQLTCAGPDGVLGTADDLVASTTTDANGNYLFTDIPAGICEVAVDVNTGPAGKVPGRCPLIFTVDLAPGDEYLDADFCFKYPPPVSIGDTVYCDLDDDGVQDPEDPGIPGVTVELTCAGEDGVLGTADDLTASTTTDANGTYLFSDIPADECLVEVDDTTVPEPKVPGRCPESFQVTLNPGDVYLDADFCFKYPPPGEIGDTVYCDDNDNGVQDPGEPGIPGVTVNLVCAGDDGVLGTADDLTASAVTDGDGKYLFVDVPPGLCDVSVDVSTAPADKVPGQCPLEFQVDLQPGESYLDADFCFKNSEECLLTVEAFCATEVEPPPSGNDCDGKVLRLVMRYTGEGCDASSNTQDPSATDCFDHSSPLPETAWIVVTDKETPSHRRALIWFAGEVSIGETFEATAANAGEERLKGDTRVFVLDGEGGSILQSVRFHTSCSQPLNVGDQFGAHRVVELETTRGGVASEPSDGGDGGGLTELAEHCTLPAGGGEVTLVYRITNPLEDVTATDVEVVDDFGPVPGSPIAAIGPGEFVELTRVVTISESTEVTVTATGAPGDCTDSDHVTIDVDEPPQGGGEGCTPGYWRQAHHYDSWAAPYTPDTLFSDVFEDAFPGQTLGQVVRARGGGLNALGRHTVAALLNGASGGVDAGITDAEVISAFNAVFPGSDDDYEALKNAFAAINELGCPLN